MVVEVKKAWFRIAESHRPQRDNGIGPDGLKTYAVRLFRDQLYCHRSATAGSTRSARQAGIAAEASVTSTVNPVAATYTTGSAGPTPTSIAVTTRASAAAASEPTTRPAAANAIPCRITSQMMSFGWAPS